MFGTKRQYSHQISSGRVEVVETTLPRHLRGYDEYTTQTITEGPLTRLLRRRR
ncbi:hypothetical protein QTQ03_26535 [Micromonospora sp. WMMA1363]|uniref:hypothetical protein n=1 Tax=Micromonospora sp. WMMA1363 TaxID=3053985 RepID=UPI00259C740E|nr:hypothetical protein [Micromonospora sp. WMMA1363]MDM4720126.1 hypothetical protein [Micromonospora sp. WMMA1363]MDM4721351.1 hypothetical protein [Micromonospora sp. WMMA1363]MDM4722986.1 hypothetical protein [Micromonospora sp. WMMA1363]